MRKIGLCCISMTLQQHGIKSSTMTKTRFLSLNRGVATETIANRLLNNITVARKTIEYCIDNNWNYRISSSLFPLQTLPELNITIENFHNFESIKSELNIVGTLIKKHNIRCSTHPDQFVVIGSINPDVRNKSVIELINHGKMMDSFGLSQNYDSPINIHMNCYKGSSLKDTAQRFIDIYHTLPDNVKSRLVLENEDKLNSWSVQQLYDYIYQQIGIPITYDSHHFRLNNPENLSHNDAIKLCIGTWGKFKPLFHFSNGKLSDKDRSHSDYVKTLHSELFEHNVDIEFEFKMKDFAIKKFEQDFPNLSENSSCVNGLNMVS